METIVPARWFFAPKGAKEFPYPNAFCSNVWAKHGEESAPGPGEISRARVFNKGQNTGYFGQCTVGNPQWFADGLLPANVLTPPLPAPLPCCKGVGCGNCIGGVPKAWSLSATDFFGFPYDGLNGSYVLSWDFGCRWAEAVGSASWGVEFNGALWTLGGSVEGGIPLNVLYSLANPDHKYHCQGPNMWKFSSSSTPVDYYPLYLTTYPVM